MALLMEQLENSNFKCVAISCVEQYYLNQATYTISCIFPDTNCVFITYEISKYVKITPCPAQASRGYYGDQNQGLIAHEVQTKLIYLINNI